MSTPKAIFYDLDGTLRRNHPAGRDVFADHATCLGLNITSADRLCSARREHAYWASSDDLSADLDQFGDATPDFWQNYSFRQLLWLGCPEHRAPDLARQLNNYMDTHFQPTDTLFDGASDTLAALRQRGFIVAVVSNRERPLNDYLQEKGILAHCHFSLAAGEVNSWKPDPEIFIHAAQRAGVQPGEAVYIGDNYYADIVGARRAGLQPILFDPAGVFPEADCPVLQNHPQIFDLLERTQP